MSENESGSNKFVSGLLVGFLLGVVVAGGVGGSFVMVQRQRSTVMEQARAVELRQAMIEAENAREMALAARDAQAKQMKQEAEARIEGQALAKEGGPERLDPPAVED